MTTIKGYENYLIFEDGVVMNSKTGREIKSRLNRGYYIIGLRNDNKRKDLKLHRLIALAFIPNPDNKPVIDHINRNKLDNRIENLRWATIQENSRNLTCYSNTGYHFISKIKDKCMVQGFTYRFTINRPDLKIRYNNKDLEVVKEYRNKFCSENNIEFNDNL